MAVARLRAAEPQRSRMPSSTPSRRRPRRRSVPLDPRASARAAGLRYSTAAKPGISRGVLVKVSSPHGAIELPAYVSESLHPGVVAIPTGQRYAPYQIGRYVAAPSTSQNPVALLAPGADAASGGPLYGGTRVTLAKTGSG